MSTRRLFGELFIMIGTVGGAWIGYAAGAQFDHAVHLTLAFVGMGLGGAFVDMCLKGDRK